MSQRNKKCEACSYDAIQRRRDFQHHGCGSTGFLVRPTTFWVHRPPCLIRFRRSFLFPGKTRRRSASFGHSLILVNRPQFLHPCRRLVGFAWMAFMQTK